MQIYEVIADRQYELQCSNTPRYKKYCVLFMILLSIKNLREKSV